MGIKRKQRIGLLEVMESSTGSKAPKKIALTQLPPPLSTQPPRLDLIDHKRKRDQKGQEAAKGGKGPLPKKAEVQR